METGDFSEFDHVSTRWGEVVIRAEHPPAPEGRYYARASVAGEGEASFARAEWWLSWGLGVTYRSEVSIYLPRNFYESQKGAIQLMGWDTYPKLDNQLRLIIWDLDRRARLFLKVDGRDRELTDSFEIPAGQWVRLAIEQRISEDDGWSRVYMNGETVAESQGRTAAAYPITRMRYGLVAVDVEQQTEPLSVYFDDAVLSIWQGSDEGPAEAP